MRNRFVMFAIAMLLLSVMGCSRPRTFINANTDWTFYKQLGVLPFVNLTSDRFAGEKVQSAFITELFLAEKFQVMEPGEFNSRVNQETKTAGLQPGQELSLDQIKAIGQKAGLQGVIEGTVREYSMVRVGQVDYPMISLSLRMIDVPTGTVIWMTSFSTKGGPKLPLISIGETHTLSELTQKTCHQVVSDFINRAF
jgi:TolB-like protein